ncbi:MAG: endo alpha-1,4 polygalactosaminidase, partial [Puniceicoccales bacterium]
VRDPAWRSFVIDKLVTPIRDQGYDGLFLDTVDSFELLIQKEPQAEVALHAAMVRLLKEIRGAFPEGVIVMNRGLPLLESVKDAVDGVLVESVFQTFDFDKNAYAAVPESDTAWLLEQLGKAKALGYEVFVLDYVAPEEPELAMATGMRIASAGFRPLVSTPELMGLSLAPLRPIARELIVLYGSVPASDGLEYPADTFTFQAWSPSLEWLGFELKYHSLLNEGLPSLPSAQQCAGIVIDADMVVPEGKADELWLFLERAIEQGSKVFFCGSLPPVPPSMLPRVKALLGVEGSLSYINLADVPRLEETYPERSGFETPLIASPENFMEIHAPDEADVWVRSFGSDSSGEYQMDGVFVADWGGLVLRPFDGVVDPLRQLLLYFDPLVLGEAIFGPIDYPVPDVTTAYGQRIFYSHIDGDGMYSKSAVELGKYSGQVIQERILEKYPLPVTVSFITAEVEGLVANLQEPTPGEFAQLARKMLALPNVEPASHTFSHPFFWSLEDPQSSNYNEQSLEIGDEYTVGDVNYAQEIIGSVDYINTNLLEGAKSCDLVLWSGNCRPPPEALEIAEEAGILTMNGGDTIITNAAPYRSFIAPKAMSWNGQTQIFAANQNENLYNNAFGDGLYGGYDNVIETFDLTESPVRFKPVDVYYHFYSADRPDAFRALETVMDWVMKQSLYPMTATQYVQLVLASIEAKSFRTVSGFQLSADKALTTWRYPVSMGYPDFEQSRGVLGFNDFQGQRYLTTDGKEVVELVLSQAKPTQPYLVSSTIPVSFEQNATTLTIKASGWGPGVVVIANAASIGAPTLPKGASFDVDDSGTATLKIRPGMEVVFPSIKEGLPE